MLTTVAEIRERITKIEEVSQNGIIGSREHWELLDELWEGVLRAIGECASPTPSVLAREALKVLDLFRDNS